MFDTKTSRTTADNCAEHRWSRFAGGSLSNGGKVEYRQCNDCLAMKITWHADLIRDGKLIEVVDEKIVEPNWVTK